MKAVVVGYGSVGTRHVRVLTELGCQVAVVSKRAVDVSVRYATLPEAMEAFSPEYIVIATPTAEHEAAVLEARTVGFKGPILVEKPLFDRYREPAELTIDTDNIFVAYNLRFHPALQRLHSLLQEERIVTFHTYVGQYLPLWRPDRDYRTLYSAYNEGGGVLRDLSHELDYTYWLCGAWKRLAAIGGQYSHLEIKSDDVFSIMLETERAPVATIQVNYIDRVTQRTIIVNTDHHTFIVDFIAGSLSIDGAEETFTIDRDYTYREQHRAIMRNDQTTLCTFERGNDIMKIIKAAEQANSTHIWVHQ